LNEKYIGKNNSYQLFISNRFLRLFPIYWTVLILTALVAFIVIIKTNGNNLSHFYNYIEYSDNLRIDSFIFLIFTNLFVFFQDIVMFLGLDTSTGQLFFTSNFQETTPQLYQFLFIPQAWSIGIEITFYLIAPYIVRKKLGIIFLLIILSLILRLILSYNGLNHDPWSYRFFPTELVFFLFGVLAYKIYVYFRAIEVKKYYLYAAFISILTCILFFNFLTLHYKYLIFLVLFFSCLPFIFILSKKWKYDMYIGELSYPIYISHMLVLYCIHIFKIPLFYGLGLSLTLFTVVFSIVLNEFVAKKIERIRQKRIM